VDLNSSELRAEFVVDAFEVGVVLLEVDGPAAGAVALVG
jgi:hypothetical protein